MSSTLILGNGPVALTMAKLLMSAGERVSVVGALRSTKLAFRDMINEESKKGKDFERLVSFYPRFTDVGSNIKAVVAVSKDSLSDTRFLGSIPVAAMEGDAQWPSHVAVRLYEPVDATMSAAIFVAQDTDPTALLSVKQMLESAGIHQVVKEQPDALEVMMKTSATKPSMDDIVRTVLMSNTPIDFSKTML